MTFFLSVFSGAMPQGMALSIFQSFKKRWKMGIILVQDTLPGFPHTPFRPVDESVPLGGRAWGHAAGHGPLSLQNSLVFSGVHGIMPYIIP